MNNNRYEIYRGREVGNQLMGLRLCGYAFQNEGEPFYRVRLFFLPEQNYYMSKNQGDGYTLFSKVTTTEEGKVVFQNPVGFAKIMEHIRTHLYLRFPDLSSHMFMSLHPASNNKAA